MSKCLIFGTIGNAGMSFTDKINNNLIKMFDYTVTCNETVGYVDFQKRICDNCDVSESNVRMYSPFLFSHGFICDYKNGAQINMTDYFTPLGKAFVKSLKVANKLDDEALQIKAKAITKDILALSMFNRKRTGQKDYYFDFLGFCLRYGTISVKEFNYMLYEKEIENNEKYISNISDVIEQFRNKDFDFEFLQDRTSKKGEQVREQFPDNTFNYTRNLLVETGLITELESKIYKITPGKEYIVSKLIEEEQW